MAWQAAAASVRRRAEADRGGRPAPHDASHFVGRHAAANHGQVREGREIYMGMNEQSYQEKYPPITEEEARKAMH